MYRIRAYAGLLAISFFIFINAFIWLAVFAREEDGILTVAFLDVGQGDAIFIEAPGGNQILIDGGPDSSVVRELSSVMSFFDRSLDVVVATHPDKDHISGLIEVLKHYEVSYFLEPHVMHDSGVYQSLRAAVEDEGLEVKEARRGMRINLGEGVFAEILFPDRDVFRVETNLSSIVMQLTYGEVKFLFTGDAPQSIERYLTSLDGTRLLSDVLKVGHHGSKTSSDRNFVSAVSPRIAVISAGARNSYGHPHKEVLDTLRVFDVEVLSTAREGTLLLKSDGKTLTHD